MSVTAGSIVNKISELRSKIAVYESLKLYLLTNCVTREDERDKTVRIQPEIVLAREDFTAVPESHVIDIADEIRELIDQFKAELEQWENMPITLPEPTAKGDKPKAKKKGVGDGAQQEAVGDQREGAAAPKDPQH